LRVWGGLSGSFVGGGGGRWGGWGWGGRGGGWAALLGGGGGALWGVSISSSGSAPTRYGALTWNNLPARPFAAPDDPLLVTGTHGSPSPPRANRFQRLEMRAQRAQAKKVLSQGTVPCGVRVKPRLTCDRALGEPFATKKGTAGWVSSETRPGCGCGGWISYMYTNTGWMWVRS